MESKKHWKFFEQQLAKDTKLSKQDLKDLGLEHKKYNGKRNKKPKKIKAEKNDSN